MGANGIGGFWAGGEGAGGQEGGFCVEGVEAGEGQGGIGGVVLVVASSGSLSSERTLGV